VKKDEESKVAAKILMMIEVSLGQNAIERWRRQHKFT